MFTFFKRTIHTQILGPRVNITPKLQSQANINRINTIEYTNILPIYTMPDV